MRTLAIIVSVMVVCSVLLVQPAEADIYSEMATCACNLLYHPVCASNNETYSNDCVLKCASETPTGRSLGLYKVKDGPCHETDL
ncbi:trypsin inhibitor ClTI-1-like [Anopheles bellator]|uniref:trypsin inhibitor ClTI-1-like n=1 Tax=Anopheles bellator TaxID=139047 RepID=UPI002647B6E5|nr:trypsin inhibitor ClTI-1-like [Anopheles bellator]